MPKTKCAVRSPSKKKLSETIIKEEPGDTRTASESWADSNQVLTRKDEPHNRIEFPHSSNKPVVNSSEDESDGATVCTGHEHFELDVKDEVVQFQVDTLYKMLFTDHSFSRKFKEENKCTGVECSEWSLPDEEGDCTRTVTYNITCGKNMGLKTAKTTEKQVLSHCSSPGSHYVIDSKARTAGIPYGDAFYLETRFCLTKNTKYTTRLRITCRVVYTRKVLGMIKGFIDKNVESGSKESYFLMVEMLHEDAKMFTRIRSPEIRQKQEIHLKRRKQLQKNRKHRNDMEINNLSSDSLADHTKYNSYLRLGAIFGILILIVSLTFLNVTLYDKLCSIQREADLLFKQKRFISEATKSTKYEDARLHVFENHTKWASVSTMMKDILSASALLLKRMQETLELINEDEQIS